MNILLNIEHRLSGVEDIVNKKSTQPTPSEMMKSTSFDYANADPTPIESVSNKYPFSSWKEAVTTGSPRRPAFSGTVPTAVSAPRNVVRGRGEVGSLKVVTRKAVCHVSRLDLDTSTDELTNFLADSGLKDIQCTRIKAKEGQTLYTASFRVACDYSCKEMLFKEDTWPHGVEVREWFFNNKK